MFVDADNKVVRPAPIPRSHRPVPACAAGFPGGIGDGMVEIDMPAAETDAAAALDALLQSES